LIYDFFVKYTKLLQLARDRNDAELCIERSIALLNANLETGFFPCFTQGDPTLVAELGSGIAQFKDALKGRWPVPAKTQRLLS
jgi:hypothetical protein